MNARNIREKFSRSLEKSTHVYRQSENNSLSNDKKKIKYNKKLKLDLVLKNYLKNQIRLIDSMKKPQYKFANNIAARELIHEQFAVLAQVKEIHINKSTTLTKENILNHFYSFGYQRSIIINNIAEYVVKAIPQLSFKDFYKFLIEGLLSGYIEVQKQICYSIYSNFNSKLHLLHVYEWFDDSLCQIVIEDLIVIYEALKNKSPQCKYEESPRLRKSSIVSNTSFFNKSPRVTNSLVNKRKQKHTFLIVDPLEEDYITQCKEGIMEQKNVYISFEEFNRIEFANRVPRLFFFMIHLICGKGITEYYSEVLNIRTFQYSYSNNNGRNIYIVNRQPTDHIKGELIRENKILSRKAIKVCPAANKVVIDASVRLFQTLRQSSNSKDSNLKAKKIITKEHFIYNSVSSFTQ